MKPKIKVFISYAKDDREVAKKLYKNLKHPSIALWIDTENLAPGQNWKNGIYKAIKESNFFLALLSSKSISKKGFVQKELKIALDILDETPQSKTFIIPIRLDDCKLEDERLLNLHYVDLFASFSKGLKKIFHVLLSEEKEEELKSTLIYNQQWLTQGLEERLMHIRETALKIYSLDETDEYKYGENHCKCIENAIHHLIPGPHYEKLHLEERFFLLASSWIINSPWEKYRYLLFANESTYNEYNKFACSSLDEDFNRKFLGISSEEAKIFQQMIKYHACTKNINICPEIIPLRTRYIRVRLLTAYLRLATAIHMDDCDIPISLFDFFRAANSPELFHLFKNQLQIIFQPKPDENIIEVFLDKQVDSTGILIKSIINELNFYLDSVRDILYKGGITNYFTIEVKSFEGISEEKRIKIEKIVKEFALSFELDDVNILSFYLSSIRDIVQKEDVNPKKVLQEIIQLQEIAKEVNSLRPYHVGLERYNIELNKILKESDHIEKKLKKIEQWAKKSLDDHKNRISGVSKIGAKELCNFNNFFIFGFSKTIIEVLRKMVSQNKDKNNINIYICKSQKPRFDTARHLYYFEGINFETQLKEAVPYTQIESIPEILIASACELNLNKNGVILFGANGITTNAECGHSAGHLSIAIIAKHYNIPVYVLCDSYKIGELRAKESIFGEGEDLWLKAIPQWQENNSINSISLLNLRESIIEPNLIYKIITEDDSFTVPEFIIKYKKK